MTTENKIEFTDTQFRLFQKLIMELTSITIADQKKELIYGRLTRRLRALKLDSFEAYYKLVKSGDHPEVENFINVVTTNLTSFFREKHHFAHLKSVVIPRMIEENSNTRKLRIWSAGCSTGEEPYSIAMTIMEALPDIGSWDVKILATDIDSEVISTASKGVYKENQIDNLSSEQKKKWFKKGKGEHQGYVRVHPDLQNLIVFKKLNLLAPWPVKGPVDVLFCRNVVIYFDKPTQKILFEKFSKILSSQGHMYIGHSETLYNVSETFELLGKTIYQKCA